MKGLVAVLLALVLAGLAAWYYFAASEAAPSAELTPEESAQIEAEVTEAAAGLLESFRTLDAGTVGEWFHPTEVSWTSDGTIYDRAGLIEFLVSFLGTMESWAGGWVETRVKVLNPDAAMFQGRYEATDYLRDGRVLHWPGTANFTMLMERTPEGWKATIGNWSNDSGQEVETG
jgi:hypothetical protein